MKPIRWASGPWPAAADPFSLPAPADRHVDFGLRMDNLHPLSLLNRIFAAEGWHWHQA
jgi:hypothetical protein